MQSGGFATLNRPAKFGFFPAGKGFSLRKTISRSCKGGGRVPAAQVCFSEGFLTSEVTAQISQNFAL